MTILIAAIDDSAACRPVLALAARVAAPAGMEVVAVHVEPPESPAEAAGSARTVRTATDALDVTVLVRRGDPVTELESALRELDAAALVIGARSLPAGAVPVGHVALDLVQRVAVPVFVVPPNSQDRPLQRILVAFEGDGERETLQACGDAVGGVDDADVFAVHVFAPDDLPPFCDDPVFETEAWSREFLRIMAASPDTHVHVELRVGDPAAEVSGARNDVNADLVVLAWGGDLSGSHARVVRRTLETTSVPVLLLSAARSRDTRTIVASSPGGGR